MRARAQDVRFAQKSRAHTMFATLKEIVAFARTGHCAFGHVTFFCLMRATRGRDHSIVCKQNKLAVFYVFGMPRKSVQTKDFLKF